MSLSVTPPFTLTEEERSLLPSDSDVEFYAEHGWYLSKKLFTAIRFLLVDIEQFDGHVLVNADYLRRVFKWRWHRLRLSGGGKHPDHHPNNRNIPHGNSAPGHR